MGKLGPLGLISPPGIICSKLLPSRYAAGKLPESVLIRNDFLRGCIHERLQNDF